MDKAGVKMLINDVENKEELFNIIVSELRSHGIKYRKEKRSKPGQVKEKRAVDSSSCCLSKLLLFSG